MTTEGKGLASNKTKDNFQSRCLHKFTLNTLPLLQTHRTDFKKGGGDLAELQNKGNIPFAPKLGYKNN